MTRAMHNPALLLLNDSPAAADRRAGRAVCGNRDKVGTPTPQPSQFVQSG